MMRCAWRYLACRPSRSIAIIAGVGLCTILMLFLISVYRGVSDGTLEYIRANRADLWVMQENATNIVRGSSLLLPKRCQSLPNVAGVRALSPILLTLSVVKTATDTGTVYLVGFDPAAEWGGPPVVIAGTNVRGDNDIVLDERMAAKMRLAPGDSLDINGTRLYVVGLSSGTNAAVIQYAFVTLRTAQMLFGQVKIVSAYLVSLYDDADIQKTRITIAKAIRDVSVFTYDEFLANNRREMQSGFLPFIVAVCTITVIVLVCVLSLLLSIVVLERRADFAVMKTIGAPPFTLPHLVLSLAGLIAVSGVIVGFVLFPAVSQIVQSLAPELTPRTTNRELLATAFTVICACSLATLVPLRKLRTIYAAESFQ